MGNLKTPKNIRDSIDKYQRTTKGIINIKKNTLKRKERHPHYMRDYMAIKRKEAIKKGMCQHCFKTPAKLKQNNGKYVYCADCMEKNRIRLNEYHRRRKNEE